MFLLDIGQKDLTTAVTILPLAINKTTCWCSSSVFLVSSFFYKGKAVGFPA